MADIYFGEGGSDTTGDGSLENPYRSRDGAVAAASGSDVLVLLDGINEVAESDGYWNLAENFDIRAQTPRKAILRPVGAYDYVARTSPALAASSNPTIVRGVVVEAAANSGSAFRFEQDDAEDILLRLENCEFKDGINWTLYIRQKRGTCQVYGCKIVNSTATQAFASSPLASDIANATLDVNQLDLELSTTTNGDIGVYVQKNDTLTYTYDVNMKGVNGRMDFIGQSVGGYMVFLYGVVAPKFSNFDLTVSSPAGSSVSTWGIYVRSKATAKTTAFNISDGRIRYDSPVGYGIQAISDLASTGGTSGTISGVEIVGTYYPDQTPHNFACSEDSIVTVKGCKSFDGYVGYLASVTQSGTLIEGNLAFDCYGPSIYLKGTKACTVRNNVCIVTNKHVQREVGIISVTNQGGPSSLGGDIENNLIIVEDVTKIHAILQKREAGNVCTFSNNVIIIPDTVDVSTAVLFAYESVTANNTYAQWIAQTEVTDDVIIQYPLDKIKEMIAMYGGDYIDIKSTTEKSLVKLSSSGGVDNTVRVHYDRKKKNSEIMVALQRASEVIQERRQVN